jgi:hypothetical protein
LLQVLIHAFVRDILPQNYTSEVPSERLVNVDKTLDFHVIVDVHGVIADGVNHDIVGCLSHQLAQK